MRVKYLLLGLMALVLLSCEKMENIDIDGGTKPIVFNVSVLDANGVDLLNPENSNSIPYGGIRALYKGIEYQCQNDLSMFHTKVCSVDFFGLNVFKYPDREMYRLQFGQFDGTKSYSNEEVIISWGDGTYDKIKFNRKYKSKRNGESETSQEWFLNETKVSGGLIKVVK